MLNIQLQKKELVHLDFTNYKDLKFKEVHTAKTPPKNCSSNDQKFTNITHYNPLVYRGWNWHEIDMIFF